MSNPYVIITDVNPKEYFEQFKNRKFNKIHKRIRKQALGMDFHNYANRIFSLSAYKELHSAIPEKQVQKCLQVKRGKMIMTTISKVAQVNDKRFYV